MHERVLGDYKLIKQIGQGTLGQVFLGEHRFIKKQYALKILDQKLAANQGFVERFEADIALLATLDHPHIVKIHHVSYAEGLYFLVMDWIVDDQGEAQNLFQLTSGQKKLSEEEIYVLISQLSSAIDYIHSKKQGNLQLSHQSLKPTNLLVGKKRENFHLFLADTGLSRLVGSGEVLKRTCQSVSETMISSFSFDDVEAKNEKDKNAFLQTYAFLAPEQKRGEKAEGKADIYAFGVLVYFLLMNQLPEGIFPMPSSKGYRRFDWDHLIKKCLQSDPDSRPSSLSTLVREIKDNHSCQEGGFVPFERDKHEAGVDVPFPKTIPIDSLALRNELSLSVSTESSDLSHSLKPLLHTPHLQRPEKDLDPGAIFQIQSTVKTYNPEPKDISHIEPLLSEMRVISGGDFYRGSQDGSRDEIPRHQITLSSFAIDIHPVTNEQFVRFLEVMGGEKDSQHNDIIRLRDSRIKRSGGKLTIESGYSKHPVVGVTWYGGVAYARWIGKRLPTEAEWEIAARGGREVFLYPCGDDIEKSQANFFSSDTTPVMSYAPNIYGLYDMAGNVYEWCHDWYGYNYYEHSLQEPENPQGPLQGVYRVLRGGCWKSLKEDLRCSRRHRNNPGTVNSTYGFRCAADVQNS